MSAVYAEDSFLPPLTHKRHAMQKKKRKGKCFVLYVYGSTLAELKISHWSSWIYAVDERARPTYSGKIDCVNPFHRNGATVLTFLAISTG
jgi:hypothetical protein